MMLFTVQMLQYCWANESDIGYVFVSILPQKYFVQQIGGKYVNVAVMVGADKSPELYEPSSKQMALLQRSQLYFRIGIPFENAWIDTVGALNNDLRIVECCMEINSSIADKQAIDPHVWVSPVNAKYIALKIKQALVDILPMHTKEFTANYSTLIDDLDRLDTYIRSRLTNLQNRYIVVYHPAWGYYAKTYGLIQLAIEQHGQEPKARHLSQLIEFAKQKNIRRVFVQKQSNKNYAFLFAKQIDAELVELDPLAEDYIKNLYHITDIIANEHVYK